ncbi:hypothetical protein [Rhizorhapis sp.]|uniref:hypothetical protein n=1 Tax=Rhizorhapis sp. TaxID=1968842 RepID=UPI002B470CB0|nr:hypothetical protein [Rhizorhapis sp.]HKR17961.1 hypothetical protein [Rhizorhapis sp.]
MRIQTRVLLITALALPSIVLPGYPELTPAWFTDDLAGVPVVIWFVMAWFAALTLASWIPVDGNEPR